METTLVRTASFPILPLSRTSSLSSIPPSSPKITFCSETSNTNTNTKHGVVAIKRSSSDSDLIRETLSSQMGPEDLGIIVDDGSNGFGNGKGNRRGNNGKGGNNDKNNEIGEYYKQMLKFNPGDPLLLRNYGKYLHEVEKNVEKAEEYYGRAILADPDDGELLSLYGNLIWETSKDEERAQLYYDQALHASPKDWSVLGSYAHFLWGVKDDEEAKRERDVVHAIVGVN